MPNETPKDAKGILWIDPTGQRMSIARSNANASSLEALIENGAVTIRAHLCRFKEFGRTPSDPNVEYTREQMYFTIFLSNCQITWEDQ